MLSRKRDRRMMVVCRLALTVLLLVVCVDLSTACYQQCSTIFNQKIRQLVGLQDSNLLTQRSCQAMAEQMRCLEGKRATCDATSLQYVNTILNFIRPDYQTTCTRVSSSSGSGNVTSMVTSPRQLLTQCNRRAHQCYVTFNATYAPAMLQPLKNMTVICQSLDNYTACLEELLPECGPFIGRAIHSIKIMQQHNSYICSAGVNTETMTECINGTMECYRDFNATFAPAVNSYNMPNMCSSMDNYTTCLNALHTRQECQRFTQQALAGVLTLKRQYAMYCGSDGGKQAQKCVTDFQQCYGRFNVTYFPAIHRGNMDGICSSVQQYSSCVEPLYTECGRHMAQALTSVRILKEQFSLQCDPEFQKLSACQPLMTCLKNFASGYLPTNPSSSSSLCTTLSAYFPCVESSLAQCQIAPGDTKVDFSQLGSLTGAYCHNLLGNRVLNTCPEFLRCTSGIVLVSTADPSAMFDASTWCSYMDMSLSCVDRAVNTPSCGLTNDDTIRGHLTQQRTMKRNVCKMASVPPLTTPPTMAMGAERTSPKPVAGHVRKEGTKEGQDGSDANTIAPRIFSLVILSLVCTASLL